MIQVLDTPVNVYSKHLQGNTFSLGPDESVPMGFSLQ